jgi:hypothetical protein
MLSDGVAGENCIVYHNGTANVFSNMERIYLQTLQFRSVRETAHKKLYLQRILTRYGGQNFSIFGYEEGAGLSRTKVFDDIVGDLKIDALYIFDKALLTTHHFVVLKDDSYTPKPLHIVEA